MNMDSGCFCSGKNAGCVQTNFTLLSLSRVEEEFVKAAWSPINMVLWFRWVSPKQSFIKAWSPVCGGGRCCRHLQIEHLGDGALLQGM